MSIYFLVLTIFDFIKGLAPDLRPLPCLGCEPLVFLIWVPFNLREPAPDLLVCASFLPATLAFCCLFFLILADFTGSVFWKQVLGFATIRPFLGPDEHLKPCLGAFPLVRLRIWLTPSAMAEWSGWVSRLSTSSAEIFSDTRSCGTTSCVWSPLMALDIVALDVVSLDSFDARITSVIFIRVFIGLTPNKTKPNA